MLVVQVFNDVVMVVLIDLEYDGLDGGVAFNQDTCSRRNESVVAFLQRTLPTFHSFGHYRSFPRTRVGLDEYCIVMLMEQNLKSWCSSRVTKHCQALDS